jgi:hypothetical protein
MTQAENWKRATGCWYYQTLDIFLETFFDPIEYRKTHLKRCDG